jgi:hypothetical protein
MNHAIRNRYRSCALLSLTLAIWLPSPAQAAADEENQPKKLVLYPSPAPRPALKYQFMPTPLERKPGNAVVFYGKLKAERNGFYCDRKLQDTLYSYLDAPLETLRDAKEIDMLPSVLRFLRRGAVCEDCDWQITLREDGFETLLPEIQESREYARFLRLIARKQIARGQFDEAAETLKYGFAFGRHVGENPTLVAGLVGNTIVNMMCETVEEFIQQPGSPNLYWALTYLPEPMIDLRENMDGEVIGFYASFPELRSVDEPIGDAGYWRERYWKTVERLNGFISYHRGEDMPPMHFALAMRSYPVAKRALIERGMTREEVEAMPVGRAILLATARIYDEVKDEMFKAYFLPYWQAQPLLDQADKRLMALARSGAEPLPVASGLLPATGSARTAYTRLEQRIAFLRVIEALRLHGAANGGRLPRQLTEVSEAPIPVDPVTGKPFHYELRGETAAVEAAPLPGWQLRYEITLGKTTQK